MQLVGREPRALAETARRVEAAGAAIIDINMGCPARRVSGALAGAALMRDLDHAERIISAVVEAVSVPVTVKMRLGWDEASLNAPELARRAERPASRMVTVHGRTRAQFYAGRADWSASRAVVEAVAIPVSSTAIAPRSRMRARCWRSPARRASWSGARRWARRGSPAPSRARWPTAAPVRAAVP